MDILNRPIVDYYRESLKDARIRGFLWVITLIAREADIDDLYPDLCQSWDSLDSLTGKYFLFLLAGKEKLKQGDRARFGEINPGSKEGARFIDFDANRKRTDWVYRLRKNQTEVVHSLKEYFDLAESNIPCFVFTDLWSSDFENTCIPISGKKMIGRHKNKIYEYLKERLFNRIGGLLKEYENNRNRLKELQEQKEELEEKSRHISLGFEGKILELQKELLLLAEKNIVDAKGRTLLSCINTLSYGSFDRQLRGSLSRYIDWVKEYQKREGRDFDPRLIPPEISREVERKMQIRQELLRIEEEQKKREESCRNALSEIGKRIKDMEKCENPENNKNLTIVVKNSDHTQINIGYDQSTMTVHQNVAYVDHLAVLTENVRKLADKNGIADVNPDLDSIEQECKRKKPRKKVLNPILEKLKALKGPIEFMSAVASLIDWIAKLF